MRTVPCERSVGGPFRRPGSEAASSAQGQAKVDAIARVVSTMAEQRIQMHTRIMTMNEQMMSHMISHAGQDAATMKQCPMMQHMMKGASPADSQHQN